MKINKNSYKGKLEEKELKKIIEFAKNYNSLKNYEEESNKEKKIRKGKPKWLEKYSNFLIPNRMGIRNICDNLASFFDSKGIEFEITREDTFIYFVCSFHAKDNCQLIFHVYLYDVKDDMILIEFQRRAGNVITFMEIYGAGKEFFKPTEQQTKKTKNILLEWGNEICPMDSIEQRELLQDLKNQLNSSYNDIRLGAMQILVILSKSEKNRLFMINQGIVDILIKALHQNEEENIYGCAANVTMNLSENKEFVEKMKAKGAVEKLIHFLRSILPEEGEKVPVRKIQIMKDVARALSGIYF